MATLTLEASILRPSAFWPWLSIALLSAPCGCRYRLNRLGIDPHSQVLHDWERFLALLQRILHRPPQWNAMPQPPDDRDRDLARLVTALVNDDPLTREELDAVRLHFAELARLMLISGTIFAAMRHLAMQMKSGGCQDRRRRCARTLAAARLRA